MMPQYLSSIPSLLNLIRTDLNEIQKQIPDAPLDNFFNGINHDLINFANVHHDDADSDIFRTKVLEMMHAYLKLIKEGEFDKANNKLECFVADYPAPNTSLRKGLYWTAASLLTVSLVLASISLGVFGFGVFCLLGGITLFCVSLVCTPALAIKVQPCVVDEPARRDYNQHMTVNSIFASTKAMTSFFKRMTPVVGVALENEESQSTDANPSPACKLA